MKRGPAPLPTATKRLAGTYRPDRARGEPKPKPGIPTPPSFLGEEARREWRRIVPLLHERGLLELVDRAALTAYVGAWQDLVEASRAIAEEGPTIATPRGTIVLHPQLRRLEKARLALRAFAQEFGLSPSARTRVHADPRPAPAAPGVRQRFALVRQVEGLL